MQDQMSTGEADEREDLLEVPREERGAHLK